MAVDLPMLPYDATFTFRTAFALEAFAPGSAELTVIFIADNHVGGIRLNGRPVPVPEHEDGPPFDRFTSLTIREGFVEGANVLEIDVFNGTSESAAGPDNPMALRVELRGSAVTGWKASPAVSDDARANQPRKGG